MVTKRKDKQVVVNGQTDRTKGIVKYKRAEWHSYGQSWSQKLELQLKGQTESLKGRVAVKRAEWKAKGPSNSQTGRVKA